MNGFFIVHGAGVGLSILDGHSGEKRHPRLWVSICVVIIFVEEILYTYLKGIVVLGFVNRFQIERGESGRQDIIAGAGTRIEMVGHVKFRDDGNVFHRRKDQIGRTAVLGVNVI